MSLLNAFCTQLENFFSELVNVIPEERDIKMALDAIKGARKINPRLILDLFYEHIHIPLSVHIYSKNIEYIQQYARNIIANKFNEISPAISIFDKHWSSLSETSQNAIWDYLKILCILCEKNKK